MAKLITGPAAIHEKPSAAYRYGMAVLLVVLAAAFRVIFAPMLQERWVFVLFAPATILAAWYGGIGPGATALFLSVLLADYLFIPPLQSIGRSDFRDLAEILLFVLVALVGIAVTGNLRSTKWRNSRLLDALEQKERMAADLQASQIRFRRIVEGGQEGIWELDQAGRIIYANPQIAAMLGYTTEEIVGRSAFDFVAEEGRSHTQTQWVRRQKCTNDANELHFRRRDGADLWAICGVAPVKDERGRFIGASVMLTDVTARKRAEEELKFRRTLFESISETSILGILVVSPEKRDLIYFNQRFVDLWGIPEDVLRSRSDDAALGWAVHRSADPDKFLATILEAYQHRDLRLHDEVELKDGRVFDRHGISIATNEGENYGWVWSFQDITRQKQTERSLRELNERLETALQASGIGTFRWDIRSDSLQTDENLDRLLGLKPDQKLRDFDGFLEQILPDDRERAAETIRGCARDGLTCNLDFRVLRPDGQIAWLAGKAVNIFDEESRSSCLTGACVEITERKRWEQELNAAKEQLRRYSEDLEDVVATRTRSLEESIQSMEGVCYHLAHDLRAPLRSMQGFSSILLQSCGSALDRFGKNSLERIAEAARRMDVLINDLLAYGNLSHAATPLERIDLDLVADAVVRSLADEIRSTSAIVEVRRPLPEAWGGRTVLQQCLLNLLSNALKYVAPGIRPHVQLWGEVNGESISIFVRDNGIGIDQTFHERIFHMFERLHSPQAYPGTGIGLAIVKKGVQRLGGKVLVESHPGQGSCFCIELPRYPEPGIAPPETVHSEPSAPAPESPGASRDFHSHPSVD